jgi:hypothetical protein
VLALLVAAVWTTGNALGASPARSTSSASSRSVHGRGTAHRDVAHVVHVVTPDLRPERSRQRGSVPPAVLVAAVGALSVAATSIRRASVARLVEAAAVSIRPRAPPLLVS